MLTTAQLDPNELYYILYCRLSKMSRTNILMIFLLTSAGALMHENVFFHKIGGFSMSRSKWLISFVIDLSTYERFLERLTGDINKVAIMTDKVLNAADTPEHSRLRNEYKAVLDGMGGGRFLSLREFTLTL